MKKILFLILIISLFGCNNIIKNKHSSIDFNCPRVYFSADDKVYIDGSNSLDDILLKAELNNFAIIKGCEQKGEIVIIPLDLLIIAKPMGKLQNPELNIPIYISLFDLENNLLETHYFMFSGFVKSNLEKDKYIESDLTNRFELITKYLETNQVVVGFMLDNKKRNLLN